MTSLMTSPQNKTQKPPKAWSASAKKTPRELAVVPSLRLFPASPFPGLRHRFRFVSAAGRSRVEAPQRGARGGRGAAKPRLDEISAGPAPRTKSEPRRRRWTKTTSAPRTPRRRGLEATDWLDSTSHFCRTGMKRQKGWHGWKIVRYEGCSVPCFPDHKGIWWGGPIEQL